jgi:hypothetical protein
LNRRHLILGAIGAAVLIGGAFAFDSYSQLMDNKNAYRDRQTIRNVMAVAYGNPPEAELDKGYRSCIRYRDKQAADQCASSYVQPDFASGWGTASAPLCDPFNVDGSVFRPGPFSAPRYGVTVAAFGLTSANVAALLEKAHTLPRHEFTTLYTRGSFGIGDGTMFYDDPSPVVSATDCDGYSITRIEYGMQHAPRSS